ANRSSIVDRRLCTAWKRFGYGCLPNGQRDVRFPDRSVPQTEPPTPRATFRLTRNKCCSTLPTAMSVATLLQDRRRDAAIDSRVNVTFANREVAHRVSGLP